MKVGDLVKERCYPEIGLIVDITSTPIDSNSYAVLDPNGNVVWFGSEYIENHCEVISASR